MSVSAVARSSNENTRIFANRSELYRAQERISEKMGQILNKEGLENNESNRSKFYQQARESASFKPIQGLAVCLNELSQANLIGDPDVRREHLKKSIIEIEYYHQHMLAQQQAGQQMTQTQRLYLDCEKRIEELDPDRSIRNEIGSWLITLKPFLELGTLAAVLYGVIKVNQYVNDSIAYFTGPGIYQCMMAHMSLFGLYQSIRYQNIIGIVLCGSFAYSQISGYRSVVN